MTDYRRRALLRRIKRLRSALVLSAGLSAEERAAVAAVADVLDDLHDLLDQGKPEA